MIRHLLIRLTCRRGRHSFAPFAKPVPVETSPDTYFVSDRPLRAAARCRRCGLLEAG